MKSHSHHFTFSRAFRFKHALATLVALGATSLPLASPDVHAGNVDTFTPGTSLSSSGNYSSGTPNNTSDVAITKSGSNALTINNGGSVVMESLYLSGAKGNTDTIDNTTAGTTSTLTLGNNAGFTNANNSVSNDLLVLKGSSVSLTIGGSSAGVLGLTIVSNGNFDNTATGNGVLTIASNITDSGTLTITGTGTDSFTGTNTFSGGLVISSGELDVSIDASLGAVPASPTAAITIDGGRLGSNSNLTFTINTNRTILLGSTAGTSFSVKGAGDITYNGKFQDLNTGGILVKQGGGILDLGGTSTYTGATSINNGTIRLNGSNLLPTTTVLNIGQGASVNVGAFDLNGNGQQVAGLVSTAGTNATANTNTVTSSTGTGTLTIAGSGAYAFGDGTTTNSGILTDSTAAGTGSGVLAVVKSGSGSQTFGGPNTYTGGTTVNGGSLVVSNASGSSATGSGAVTVNNGGSLLGAGFINAGANKVTINGTLSPGTGGTGSAGTITIASSASVGALTLGSTSILAFDITDTTTKDDVELSGSSLALNGGRLALTLPNTSKTGIDYTATYALFTDVGSFSGSGFSAVTGYDSTDYTAKLTLNGSEYDLSFTTTAVPEPATVFGGVLMIGLMGWNQRRRIRP